MASVRRLSSGSEADELLCVVVDDRKKRRMLSNRESARRSRMKKQQHLNDLLNQVTQLRKDNDEIANRVNSTTELYVQAELENNVLRAQKMELNDRLQSLNSILHVAEEVSGFSMDIPEMPDHLLQPWRLPFSSQPIMSSASISQV